MLERLGRAALLTARLIGTDRATSPGRPASATQPAAYSDAVEEGGGGSGEGSDSEEEDDDDERARREVIGDENDDYDD